MNLDFNSWFENIDKCEDPQNDYNSALIYVITHDKPCYYKRRHRFLLKSFEEDTQGNKFMQFNLPYNDNDFIENIRVPITKTQDSKVEFLCGGRNLGRVDRFLFCCAMYTPLEIKYTGEPHEFDVTYDAWIFPSNMRQELMRKKVKIGDLSFSDGIATSMK